MFYGTRLSIESVQVIRNHIDPFFYMDVVKLFQYGALKNDNPNQDSHARKDIISSACELVDIITYGHYDNIAA